MVTGLMLVSVVVGVLALTEGVLLLMLLRLSVAVLVLVALAPMLLYCRC